MTATLFACCGGRLVLPARTLVLVSREDGGNLIVEPPRPVWERSELEPEELLAWSALVAAAGRAMLDVLPQLAEGCINYWEAGNWALNEAAPPAGPKSGPRHRSVHLHLLGRSRNARSPNHRWGEAPRFPDYAERLRWAAPHARLLPAESCAVVQRTAWLLRERYAWPPQDLQPWTPCTACGQPVAAASAPPDCAACRA